MTLPNLPFRSHMFTESDVFPRPPPVQIKRTSILERRHLNNGNQGRLTLQLSRNNAMTSKYQDPDFFDDIPSSENLILENFSKISLGYENPVAYSTPGTVFRALERFSEASLGYESSKGVFTPDTAILRLDDFSRVSPSKQSLLDELWASSPEDDEIVARQEMAAVEIDSDQGSRTGSDFLTLRGSPRETSSGALSVPAPSSSIDKTSVYKEEGGKESLDPFLYLALEGMHGKSSLPSNRSRPALTAKGSCNLPLSHPEILAAEARISKFKNSPVAVQLNDDIALISGYEDGDENVPRRIEKARQRIAATSESVEFNVLVQDSEFVLLYTEGMNMRCREGVWWEGWLVVEELRGKGVTRLT